MRVLVILALTLSSCAARPGYNQLDTGASVDRGCTPAQQCDSTGGTASTVAIVILATAAAVGVGVLLHELGSAPKRPQPAGH